MGVGLLKSSGNKKRLNIRSSQAVTTDSIDPNIIDEEDSESFSTKNANGINGSWKMAARPFRISGKKKA